MSAEETSAEEMGAIGRIVGIFTSPRETFESIDKKPTWLVPFLIVVIITIVFQFLVLDITMKDELAKLEARDMPAEQYEEAQARMEGPLKYIGLVAGPIFILIAWTIVAGVLLFGGNTVMGGETKFKKVFSVIAWSSLIGLVGEILKTLLTLSKGTRQGVVTSLAVLLPTPGWGEETVLYRLLNRFDLFTIWGLILWIIGLAVVYRFTTKKSATLVLSLWVIYIVLAVGLGSVVGSLFGG